MITFIIIFLISLSATSFGAMSGGGTSLITIPALLLMGFSLPLVAVAQKISAMFWVAPAAFTYLKKRKVNWYFLLMFSGLGLLGVYAGVSLILLVDQKIMKILISILIVFMATYTFFKKNIGLKEIKIHSKARRFVSYLFAPALGFYNGILGSGNGILFSMVTIKTRGFDCIDALGYHFATIFPWEIFVVVFFVSKGYFSWGVVIPMVLGSVAGGIFGSLYAKCKGNKFIKTMFIVRGILGLKVLLGL